MLGRLSPGLRQALISSRSTSVPLASIPATGRAAVAIRFAYAQLGKPYRWGAAGPGAYDCSGLTMTAWHASGVSLPHSAQAQFASRPHVATGALRPGDLVFFGSPIHHVGLYIGGGNMIAAPHTGDVVKIQPAQGRFHRSIATRVSARSTGVGGRGRGHLDSARDRTPHLPVACRG